MHRSMTAWISREYTLLRSRVTIIASLVLTTKLAGAHGERAAPTRRSSLGQSDLLFERRGIAVVHPMGDQAVAQDEPEGAADLERCVVHPGAGVPPAHHVVDGDAVGCGDQVDHLV